MSAKIRPPGPSSGRPWIEICFQCGYHVSSPFRDPGLGCPACSNPWDATRTFSAPAPFHRSSPRRPPPTARPALPCQWWNGRNAREWGDGMGAPRPRPRCRRQRPTPPPWRGKSPTAVAWRGSSINPSVSCPSMLVPCCAMLHTDGRSIHAPRLANRPSSHVEATMMGLERRENHVRYLAFGPRWTTVFSGPENGRTGSKSRTYPKIKRKTIKIPWTLP